MTLTAVDAESLPNLVEDHLLRSPMAAIKAAMPADTAS